MSRTEIGILEGSDQSADFARFSKICIVKIFGLIFTVIKKLISHVKSRKILLSKVKGLCKTDSLENAVRSSRNGKNRDFEPLLQHKQSTYNKILYACRTKTIESCYQKKSQKNIKNSLRYALKTSKITNFHLPPVEKRSRDSSLGPLES